MTDELIQQLKHPDAARRRAAITALANSKDPAALPALAAVYRRDPDPALRELALKAGRFIRQHAGSGPQTPVDAASGPTPPPLEPAPHEVSERDAELARGYLNAAMTHHTQGDKVRAIENLGKALSLNPKLGSDSFVENLVLTLTGRSVADAMPLLIHPDRRGELIAKMGGRRKKKRAQQHGKGAETATWDNVAMDFGLYWLVITLSLIAIFVFTADAIRDMIDSVPMTTATTDVSANMDELFAASVIGLIVLAVVYGIGSVISLLIQGGSIHIAATYLLAGDGTLVYLYRRLVPFETVITLALSGGFVVLALVGSTTEIFFLTPILMILGTIGVLYKMSELVGDVYDFGWGTGCLAIVLGSVLLAMLSCGTNYVIAALLSGLLGGGG